MKRVQAEAVKRDPIRERVLAVLRENCSGLAVRHYRATASDLARWVGHPYAAATVTAKLRDLRKKKYGSHNVRCVRCPEEETGNGYIYRYWLEE